MLGNYNNQNNNKMVESTYYSRFRIKNEDTKLSLNASFWAGSLKLAITEIGGERSFNNKIEELAYIHLSPTKAHLLVNCIDNILSDGFSSNKILGVNTGVGENQGIFVVACENNTPYIILGKVNPSGSFINSQKFIFNNDYQYSINFKDIKSLKFEKQYDNKLELIQLRNLLEDFSRSSNGAYGYSVHDVARYEISKMNNKLYQIGSKLNTDFASGKYDKGSSSDSFFNKFDNNESSSKNKNTELYDDDEDPFL